SGDVCHRAPRGHGSVLGEGAISVARAVKGFAVLYEQPVVTTTVRTVVAHADQHPTAVQALPFELEPESPLPQHIERSTLAFRLPETPIPQLHRAATVLPLGDGALEVSIIEWVVLDLDREAFHLRVEGRCPGDRPGLEHSIELEPQVIMQTAGGVLLDHEAQMIGGRDLTLAAWFSGLAEVPLGLISRESSSGHGSFLCTTGAIRILFHLILIGSARRFNTPRA